MLETVMAYLVKLGYTVEEQGRTVKFLTVFRDGLPLGFILPDLSVRMLTGTDCGDIERIVAFVRENADGELVAGSEYLLASYRGSRLTTYYDVEAQAVRFAVYVAALDGTVQTVSEQEPDAAKYSFLVRSGLMPEHVLRTAKQPVRYRLRQRMINYLLRKNAPSAQ